MTSADTENRSGTSSSRKRAAAAPSLHPFLLLKRLMPTGLYWRSLIIIVAPMVLLQVVVTYVFLERHWQLVTERLSAKTVAEIAMLIEEYEENPTPLDASRIARRAGENLGLPIAFLEGETLPETPSSVGGLLADSLNDEIRKRIARPYWINTTQQNRYVDIRIAYSGGVMRVLTPASQVYASNSHIFIVWMVGTSIVLIIVAVIFLRNQIRPIERLASAAESFGMGRDVEKFRPQGASEVRRAAQAFIEMRTRIERQIEQRTAMLAGVSHDLRTPLTRFKLQLAMLPEGPEIAELREDIAEMERMLEDYLEFARGHQGEASEETDLGELIAEVSDDAIRKGHDVKLDLHGDLTLPLRRNAFKRCLTNIVDNAGKYAPHVWVTAIRDAESEDDGSIDILVDDDGEGIPEEQLEEVFRPFYRLDAARNLDKGGTGLGLAIARDIARGHGGDITLARSPMGGLRAIIHLPV
ncbi:MAG: HAMP domain-containing protein [Alphaproteobacteria bacterium]|nr:HAMP domain-containing protein [Alphaproteobacteria bacterium]MDX5415289.1 HAMP domain-containing protein [Alphaproteobacteria bacterium]MDX5492498.1 HAMP domain-containing protein [Alphaproteobacteria bacterium]